MRPYSSDLRRKVLAAHERGASQRQIAARFDLALSTVHGWIKRHRETGSLSPRSAPGAAPKLDTDAQTMLRRIAEAQPDATLREWSEALRAQTGLRLDPSTVRRYLRRMGWTRKKRRHVLPSAAAMT